MVASEEDLEDEMEVALEVVGSEQGDPEHLKPHILPSSVGTYYLPLPLISAASN